MQGNNAAEQGAEVMKRAQSILPDVKNKLSISNDVIVVNL